ncbi:PRTRC system protein D [Campylobacter hyointestinalis subsp. hyointestinalis]|uniref:PRTRC system protein D n=1 Tax=Campylobacter hyointestinalis subsp. hyointestinalis TaxID=91352 RepID=A0A9W5AUW7_CAMHY|nr:ParM/StbA family protein [Campylobacter hyointestinalis]CUU88637.1 PRTRC system protein D [Campylobacter hyointestinalis subsp. hyointestinalis]
MRLALDIGFGHTKYAYHDGKQMIIGKIPSVVATTVENLDDLSSDVLEYDGTTYYVGNLALKSKKKDIIEIDDYEKLETYSPLLIAQVIKENNLTDITEISCGLSPAHKDNNAAYKSAIEHFIISKNEYNFKISLLPQGVGAVKCIQGNIDNKNFSSMKGVKDYLIVDIGFNTTDMVFVFGGNIQKGKISKDNSFENTGVTVIAKNMQDHIRKEYDKSMTIDQCLETIMKNGFLHRGEWFDMTDVVAKFKYEYAKQTMNFLEKNYGDEFDNMEKVCFVGGGAYFIDKNYAKNIEVFANSEYMNVIGNLIFDNK